MDKKAKEEAKTEEQKNYQLIKQGKLKPKGSQKGYLNLKPLTEIDPEKAKEIRRKGYYAQQKVLEEKKTAKESLNSILHIVANGIGKGRVEEDILTEVRKKNPNLTLYDVVNLVQISKALDGSTKSAEYVRDTVGDKPADKLDVTAQSLTDEDRLLLETVNKRLEDSQNAIDVC